MNDRITNMLFVALLAGVLIASPIMRIVGHYEVFTHELREEPTQLWADSMVCYTLLGDTTIYIPRTPALDSILSDWNL